MTRKGKIVRPCRGICKDARLQQIFSEKRLPYDKGSYCPSCEVWIKEPVYEKIITTRERSFYDSKLNKMVRKTILVDEAILDKGVWCICCGSRARGKARGGNKKKPTSIEYQTLEVLGIPRAKRAKKEKKETQDKELEDSVFGEIDENGQEVPYA